MQLSITSDYATSYGSPEPYLRSIADAGFTHIHWCHQWDTDFIYSTPEIAQIALWLKQFGLKLLNIHASAGREKRWDSLLEYGRLAGVELVRNRLEMAARLESDVIILHAGASYPLQSQMLSLAELEPFARLLGVRIALENLSGLTYQRLDELLGAFEPEYVGLCYDTGHGNQMENSLDQLERMKDRLIATHIHDNDGVSDQHKIPFTGSVDWPRFMHILSASPHNLPLNLEVGNHQHQGMSEPEFLLATYRAGERLESLRDQ
jgi:sugar phosphate isomerase/epimerase